MMSTRPLTPSLTAVIGMRNASSDDGDQPPADAEHFIVCGGRLQTGWPEACDDDDCPPATTRGEDAVFRSGDPVPRALAERMWAEDPFPGPPQTLIAVDAEGNVVAGAATSEAALDDADAGALERFRQYHWDGDRR